MPDGNTRRPHLPSGAPAHGTIRQILSASPEPLTRQEILARWPESEPPPRADSRWRILTRACALGILARTGESTRLEALGYTLAPRPSAA